MDYEGPKIMPPTRLAQTIDGQANDFSDDPGLSDFRQGVMEDATHRDDDECLRTYWQM